MPSRAARAFSVRCTCSGTPLIWTVFDMLSANTMCGAPPPAPAAIQVCWKQDETILCLSTRPCAGPDCGRLSMLGRFQTETALLLRSRSQGPAGADDPRGKNRPDDAARAERAEGPGRRREILRRFAVLRWQQRSQGRQQPEGLDRPLRPLAGAHPEYAARSEERRVG